MITKAYRILRMRSVNATGTPQVELGILCLLCDAVSYSSGDICMRYCGRCHMFLADVDRYHVRADEVIGEGVPVTREGPA